ncbi:MAG: hypothetical protein D6706_12715 [Chloroflexi bacterium]|nr:MAG: hypothetical protein D6706_12715 [Chloroflexota bacterium]
MAQNRILLNGKLGEPFRAYRGNEKLTIATGWAPWWLDPEENHANWQNRQPVYNGFVLDGRFTQQLSTPWGTHVAGLWQQVPSAPGNRYEFTVEGLAWSSDDAAPGKILEPGDVNLQIGIDPTGGLDPESPLVIWSERIQPIGHWETLHLTAEAQTTIITVYLKSAPNLPKRQQAVFWRRARLRPLGQYRRGLNIVGSGDTHIILEPERPKPGEPVTVVVSSLRKHQNVSLLVLDEHERETAVSPHGYVLDGERHTWRYDFTPPNDGLYEIRFVADEGARLLSLRLLQVAREVQLVPSSSRLNYRRVYVLLPPTADIHWFVAAARGSYNGRYTIGFSADDAGIGEWEERHVLAVNPHHWPEVLTAAWFRQHYPGTKFTAVVANTPADLEAWLKNWTTDTNT